MRERVLPSANVQIIFNLHQNSLNVSVPQGIDRFERFRGALIAGPRSDFSIVDTTDMESLMGVHFKPGGIWPFLGSPTDLLHNAHVSLDALWADQAWELRDRLVAEPDAKSRFHLLENMLLRRLNQGTARHPAVAFALREFQTRENVGPISRVVGKVGLSSRRFITVFTKEVGLTPKLFCRLHRFQNTLSHIPQAGIVDWADLAIQCGYFDQAHLNHEFRAFSGLNPGSYLTHRTDHQNHARL